MEESFGSYLQRIRTEKGYNLNDIFAMTRIGPEYLKALEAEEFSKLPPHTVVKAYARAYARCLGVSDVEVMQRFAEAAGPFYRQQEAARQVKPVKTDHSLKSRLDEMVASLKLLF